MELTKPTKDNDVLAISVAEFIKTLCHSFLRV